MPEPVPHMDEGARVEDLRRERHPERLAGRPCRSGEDLAPGSHAVHRRIDHPDGHGRGREHAVRPRSRRATPRHLRVARDGPGGVEGHEDQRARRAGHRRLRGRSAQRDPRGRRGDRGRVRGRRRGGPDRIRVGAGGRRRAPPRDLRQQAGPGARGLRGDARAARVELRQPGRAVRAADRRRAGVPRDRRPAAREGGPVSRADRRPRNRTGPTICTRWPTPPARS